jgi:hypothetical protein
MSTWATAAAPDATEGDAGGEAAGALAETAVAVVETAGFAVVLTTVFGAGSVPAPELLYSFC